MSQITKYTCPNCGNYAITSGMSPLKCMYAIGWSVYDVPKMKSVEAVMLAKTPVVIIIPKNVTRSIKLKGETDRIKESQKLMGPC